MPYTDRQVLDVLAARELQVGHLQAGWITFLPGKPPLVRVRVSPQPTPEAAIEAADIFLAAREAEQKERRAGRLIEEQQRGAYFALPREALDAEGGQRIVFDIRRRTTGLALPTSITDRASVVEAWRDLIRELEAGRTP